MALDEPTAEDTSLDVGGFTFCMETELLNSIGGASIDISYMGFVIEPNNPLPNSGDGASCSTCSSGSCG